jgi:hypothetical protein
MHKDAKEVTNRSGSPMEVIVEPWGNSYTLQPGQTLQVIVQSDKPGQLEVREQHDATVLYGWEGCSVTVTLDGQEV